MQDANLSIHSHLVSGEDLGVYRRSRAKRTIAKSISKTDLEQHLDKGWSIIKELKSTYQVSQPKIPDEQFEDDVWCLMHEMGFKTLNKDRNLKLPYQNNLTKQIDVFAMDDESIVLIECKCSTGDPKQSNFKTEIEAIGGRKEGINTFLRKALGNKKFKIAYVFATKGYYLCKPDRDRLEAFGITHFDEDTIKYYSELSKQIGTASRFQLEANLFHGTTIPELDNKVAAIQGKMGGHTYYAFSIEPEKLLKLGYVLHRNQANIKLMPTYQRIMKKSRLKQINEFINDGGFFPNSIVCSIDSGGKKLNFSPANTQVENSVTKIGVLELPKKYRSVYIIDGQHRLYGYTGSKYAKTNSIPVVAFQNLDRGDQVRLFMEINENQKAVPKNLRITLESDLYWDDEDIDNRISALKSQIAIALGEELASPLYSKVIVGENQKTDITTISLKSIIDGLSQTNFFGTFKNNVVTKDGSFYKGTNESTYSLIVPFLFDAFAHVRKIAPTEWNRKQADGGILLTPTGVTSLIRLFGDIVDFLIASRGLNIKGMKPSEIISELTYYLDPIGIFLEEIDETQRKEIRSAYGTGGPLKFFRILQKAINGEREEYNPEGLSTYWEDESKTFNTQTYEMLRDIEKFLNKDFKQKLQSKFGSGWMKKLPQPVYKDIMTLAADKNYQLEGGETEVDPWNCLHLIDYKKIAIYGSFWQDIFSSEYTLPDEKQGNKDEKTKWLERLNTIRNKNMHEYSVKKDEFAYVKKIHEWLIK